MNKKSIIGLVLIFGIFIGYMWWVSPSKEEMMERQRIADSIQLAYADSMAKVDSMRLADSARVAAEKALADSLAQAGDSTALRQLQAPKRADMGMFNASTSGDTVNITVKNQLMSVSLTNMGAQISEVVLSDIYTYDSLPLQLITPAADNMNLTFSSEENRDINTRNLVFSVYRQQGSKMSEVTASDSVTLKEGDTAVYVMRAFVADSNGAKNPNRYIEFKYGFGGNDYNVDFDVTFHGLSKVVKSSTRDLDFTWKNSMNRQEKVDKSSRGSSNRNKDPEKYYSGIYYKTGGDVDNLSRGSDDDECVNHFVEWVAFKQQFFCAILMADGDSTFTNAKLEQVTDPSKKEGDPRYLCDMESTLGLAYNNDRDCTMGMSFYFGPTKFRDLRAMDRGFEKMLPLGWWIFSKAVSRYVIIPAFNFLETFNWNYGIIIIVFTFLLRLVLFPLTYKSYKGSAIMRILRPEMELLNKKYPNPDQAMQKQQEMTKLQKKAGYSPLAGCLPVLIQMPILTAMFMFYPQAFELRQKSFLWCDDLSTYDSILDLGFKIPLYGDHISLFCLLMFGMQFFYTWYTMKSQQGQASMPGMKFMMYFMPFMMLFMFNSMAAGVNLYYFISLSLTMLQMVLIRKFTSEKKVRARMAAYDLTHKNQPAKKSKFQKRLEELQKQTEQMQKQQGRK